MLKLILLEVFIVAIIIFFFILFPKIKLKYRLYKEKKIKKERQEAFRKKMEELEIK